MSKPRPVPRPLCFFRQLALPKHLPRRGELWRLTDGHMARVHLVTVCAEPALSFAYVTTRMRSRNVPLQAFRWPAKRLEQLPLC